MKIIDLVNVLNLNVFSGKNALSREVNGAYVSDLLSDVMGNAKEGQCWITLQTHKNIMAIASLKDLPAIILVGGNIPDKDTLEKSEEEGLPILGTPLDTFTICGKIYKMLNSE
ncbi:MAG: serine kinase [Bacteroidales bacterium]|nr:serine kinase [Bacteroidales bacterium]